MYQHYFSQNNRNKAKIIVIELVVKASPILSKWHRKFGVSEIFFFFFKGLHSIYLFLAVLGLRCCAWAFSSYSKRGPLFIVVRGPSHHRGLSCCGAQAPDAQAQ